MKVGMKGFMASKESFLQYCRRRYKFIYDYNWKLTNGQEVVFRCPWHGTQKVDTRRHFSGVGCLSCLAEGEKTYADFKKRIEKVHGKRYKIPKMVSGFSLQSRISCECPHHGEFTRAAYDLLNGKGCQYCAKGMLSKSQFVAQAFKKHGDAFDYSKIPDGVIKGKVKIKCKTHGYFMQYPQSHLDGDTACQDCVYDKRNPKIKHFFIYLFKISKGKAVFWKPGLANDVERRGKEHARALAKGWKIELVKAWKIDSKKGAYSTELYVLNNVPGKPVSKKIMTVGHTETKYNKLSQRKMVKLMDELLRKYLKMSRRHVHKSQKLKSK